jgi:ABC-type polysaccharide/polyol phosphate export permease
MDGVNSVTSAGNLITKSMFPAEILPMVKIVSNLFNYIFSLPLLLLFMIYYHIAFTPTMLWLPVLMLAQLLFTIGLVYFFAAINVRFRDVQHILGNFIVLWFFICPILYPTSSVPKEYHFTFYFNPMAIMTMGYQDIFINGKTPDLMAILGVMLFGVALSALGFWQFERDKELFAEEI